MYPQPPTSGSMAPVGGVLILIAGIITLIFGLVILSISDTAFFYGDSFILV
jgi:hypothetical protein